MHLLPLEKLGFSGRDDLERLQEVMCHCICQAGGSVRIYHMYLVPRYRGLPYKASGLVVTSLERPQE